MSLSKKVPCFGCDKRHPGCHPKCEGYNQWKKTRDAEIAERRAKEDMERKLNDSSYQARLRHKQLRRGRRDR